MACELTHPRPGPLPADVLECLCNSSVRSGQAARTEIFVQRVLNQRVDEGKPSLGVRQLAHERRMGGGIEDIEHLVLGPLRRLREKLEVEVPPDDRCQRQHLDGIGSESSDPGPDHLMDAVRKRHLLQGVIRDPVAHCVLVDEARLGQVS